jgi:hypothetical protein
MIALIIFEVGSKFKNQATIKYSLLAASRSGCKVSIIFSACKYPCTAKNAISNILRVLVAKHG